MQVLIIQSLECVHRTIDQDKLIILHKECTVVLIRKSRSSSKKLQHLNSSDQLQELKSASPAFEQFDISILYQILADA